MGLSQANMNPSTAILLASLAAATFAYPLQSKVVDLATFDGAKGSTYTWQAVNDPVMGGRSVGNFTIDGARKIAVWEGEVKIVPFLHAAGFCNAQAPGMDRTAHFPSAAGTDGISIKARTVAENELTAFNVQLMTKGAKHWFKSGVYSANVTITSGWQDLFIPYSAFSRTWRGEAVSWCPALSTQLEEIQNIGVGTAFPGKPGKFHVEIDHIAASATPTTTVCKSSEYCCPDAKACLTPTKTSCAKDATACGSGEVCCPLTKICVIPGNPCSTPCADGGTYCCPDALKCLKPTNPGVFCKAAGDCGSGEVCCPLTKLCVAPCADCKPTLLPFLR